MTTLAEKAGNGYRLIGEYVYDQAAFLGEDLADNYVHTFCDPKTGDAIKARVAVFADGTTLSILGPHGAVAEDADGKVIKVFYRIR